MPVLYSLTIKMHRSADLTEVAAVSDDDWALIERHHGAELHFGEVAGKHSDVVWELDFFALRVLSRDPTEIALFEKWFCGESVGSVSVVQEIANLHEYLREGVTCTCGVVGD